MEKPILELEETIAEDTMNVEFFSKDEAVTQLEKIDVLLDENGQKLIDIEDEILRDQTKIDSLDYIVAASSGLLAGIVDMFYTKEFSMEKASIYRDDKKEVNQNIETDYSDVSIFADYDQEMSEGFDDFTYHPDYLGLISNIRTQFTGCIYGIDLKTKKKCRRQMKGFNSLGTAVEKVIKGVKNWWVYSLIQITKKKVSGEEKGIPGPLKSLLYKYAKLPFFQSEENTQAFISWLDQAYDGKYITCPTGEKVPYDYSNEMGINKELKRQMLPIFLVESIVRMFYFTKRLYYLIKDGGFITFSDITFESFKTTLPLKSMALHRLISVGCMSLSAVDLLSAAIKSGGNKSEFLMRVNFLNLARFSLSISLETLFIGRKTISEYKRYQELNERCQLLGMKTSILQEQNWVKLDESEKSYLELVSWINKNAERIDSYNKEIGEDLNDIKDTTDNIDDDFRQKLLDILD